MPLRTLLVHGGADNQMSARISLATDVARRHHAKLRLIFALQGRSAAFLYAQHAPADMISRHIRAERLRAARIGARLADRAARAGIGLAWRTIEGRPDTVLAQQAAAADMLVLSQDDDGATSPLVAPVTLAAGKPVLCVPRGGPFASCGRRVLLAWNGSRESARAAHDARPFLRQAERVILFTADDETNAGTSAEDAASHLATDGVSVEIQRAPLNRRDPGRAILDAASDHGADLVVMGAYGHSRLREWAFGGATRTVLRSMTVPILLSY